MGRPTLPRRTRSVLGTAADALASRPRRFITLGAALAATFALHWVLRDPTVAWAVVPIALVAGLAGGQRSPLIVATVAAVGHLAIDVALGVDGGDILGLLLRSLTLPALALVGMAGQQIERQREGAMHRAVSEDPVTGLLNVRAFYDELGALRAANRPFTIVLADIRGMRALNERYGHPAGTDAMRLLAQVLRRSTGPEMRASRLGSDEVAVVLTGDDRQRGRAIVDEVIKRLHDEQVALPDGERFEVHAAYGIARFPEDGDDEVAVLRAADRAKERAKTAGMDRLGTASGEVDAPNLPG